MRPFATIAATTLLALLAQGCGAAGDGGTLAPGDEVRVYVSAPGAGPLAGAGRDVLDGARAALAARGGEAGGVAVEIVAVDPSGEVEAGPAGPRRTTSLSLAAVAANARQAASDSAAVAYVGELDSPASEVSLAVTNRARLAQVSPSATAVELVRPFPGSSNLPPAQGGGVRTFARVIPSDEVVEALAEAEGGRVVALADAGLGGELEGIEAGRSVIGLPLAANELPGAGDAIETVRKRAGRSPGPLAAYGFEAMALVLDAIAEVAPARGGRRDVAEAMLGALREGGPLGRHRISTAGETDLDLVGAGRLGPGGELEPAGSVGGG